MWVAADPGERTTLVDEPEHADRVTAMRTALAAWFATSAVPTATDPGLPSSGGDSDPDDDETRREAVFHPRDRAYPRSSVVNRAA